MHNPDDAECVPAPLDGGSPCDDNPLLETRARQMCHVLIEEYGEWTVGIIIIIIIIIIEFI